MVGGANFAVTDILLAVGFDRRLKRLNCQRSIVALYA